MKRGRKIVKLAIEENKEIIDKLLNLPRYESTKTNSKAEMLQYLEIIENSNFVSKNVSTIADDTEILSQNLNNILSSQRASNEHSTENLLSEIVPDEVSVSNLPKNLLKEVDAPKFLNEIFSQNPIYIIPTQTASSLEVINGDQRNEISLQADMPDSKKISQKFNDSIFNIVPQTILNEEALASQYTQQKPRINKQIIEFQPLEFIIEPPPLLYFKSTHNNISCYTDEKLELHQNVSSKNLKHPTRNTKTVKYCELNDDQEELHSIADSVSEYVHSEVSDTASDDSKWSNNETWSDALLKRTLKDSQIIKKPMEKHIIRPSKLRDKTENLECSSDGSDEDTVKITCSVKRNGKRVRNKKYCCCFCQKIVVNLSRHFISMHSEETTIARILTLPKNSKHRRAEFAKLTREGNFYHNCEVLQMKKGELILLRRPTPFEQKQYTYVNYGPCPDCLGFMLKKNIAHHMKNNCTSKSKTKLESRKPISESNAILSGMYGPNLTADFITNIVIRMRDDNITKICREDRLILKFGVMMYEKYSTTQSELIRQSMRQLGRFFVEINKACTAIKSLSDSLKPEYFDIIVQAVKTLCVTYESQVNRTEFQTPSLALKIGHALKKCISYERGNALRVGNIKKNRELESFQSIMDIEWNIRISSNALNTLHVRKFNCTQLLPITSDLIKLNNYLESEIKKYITEIEKTCQPTPSYWSRFAALLLSKIVMFNKRRSGETSRMTIDQYSMRPLWSEQTTEECKSALTQFERQLAKHFVVVEVSGKRGRRVPIILSPDMKRGIDLLLKTRKSAGISNKNPYVFARNGNLLECIRGHDCLRKCCEQAQLNSPENINGTKLRKYVATVVQIINLTENETDWLARHLGHDIRVHRDFYRLHESAVELTKVSRLLMAVDSGQVNKFAGKKLDEIELSGKYSSSFSQNETNYAKE